MRAIKIGLGLGLVWLLAGCAHTRLVQQSTNTSETISQIEKEKLLVKDSASVIDKEKSITKDSSSYKETVKEKTITGSKVDANIDCDSLKKALGALKGVTDTVDFSDPTNQTKLKFYLDANRKLHAQAQTADRKYNERTIEHTRQIENLSSQIIDKNRHIESLSSRLTEKDHEIEQLRDQVREHQDSFFVKVGKFLKDGIWFLIVIAVVVVGWRLFLKTRV